ncbi:hypothetical protein NDU88_004143 [Pleurodeles waltl]|uniref:Uncharacterized protein n=1 Tax=Pleurodeles waltl TaxID=8319 RepID=A0AAV7NNI7_PLEWA|nr:hypothetical protein NDU88_004143 [Pleurodeles waltl]
MTTRLIDFLRPAPVLCRRPCIFGNCTRLCSRPCSRACNNEAARATAACYCEARVINAAVGGSTAETVSNDKKFYLVVEPVL